MSKQAKSPKRKFSSFTLKAAIQYLGQEELLPWPIEAPLLTPQPFFLERLARLEQTFDIVLTERAKELLVDAFCEEALLRHPDLKMWKSAPLSSDDLTGVVDYLLTPRRAYIDTPLLCVIEAKKDNFEQGLAQCLVEMAACHWNNQQQGRETIAYGIVTNGDLWRFYKLDAGHIYESLPYLRIDIEKLLGVLESILLLCQAEV